jgi:hypothetical protein
MTSMNCRLMKLLSTIFTLLEEGRVPGGTPGASMTASRVHQHLEHVAVGDHGLAQPRVHGRRGMVAVWGTVPGKRIFEAAAV